QTRIALAAFLGLAPPYKISVALLRRATSVNESFPLIAAALDEDLGLEVDVGAALNMVAYVIAVLLGCQPSCCPFAGVDTQPSHVAILLCGGVSNLNAFLEESGQEIDRLSDPSATEEERQRRKRRLLKGPKEFRDVRSNRPKFG